MVLVHPAGDGLPVVGPVVDALTAPDAVPLALLTLHLHDISRGGVEWPTITTTNNLKDKIFASLSLTFSEICTP